MKIFHGILNIANIGCLLSEYQRKAGHTATFYCMSDNPFYGKPDKTILPNKQTCYAVNLLLRIKTLAAVCTRFDVFVFYFSQSLLPLNLDIAVLLSLIHI